MAKREGVAKFEKRPANASFDGAEGFGEAGGDFLLGEAAKEGEFEGANLFGGKSGESAANGRGGFLKGEVLEGVAGGQGGAAWEVVRERAGEKLGTALARAELIDRAVAGEGNGPTESGAAPGFEGGGFFPEGEEDVLDDVLGVGGLAEDSEGDGVKRAGKAVVKRGARGLVAAGHAVEKGGVFVRAGVGGPN
jgi:hypothetical protein